MPDKAAVRAEAARLGLAVAAKPDSQDICFVPSGTYAEVVARLRPDAVAPGEIVDAAGAVLGAHDGIARYTVGQAKRLGAGRPAPARVVTAIDAARRRIVVGPRTRRQPARGAARGELARGSGAAPLRVKLRARDAVQAAVVAPTPDGAEVLLDTPALAAPGQACVFYDGDRVLGGGFIAPARLTPRTLAAYLLARARAHGAA